MIIWRTAIASAVTLALLTTGTAGAQRDDKSKAGDDKCNIDFGHNDQVRSAYNNVTLLQIGTSKPEDAQKRLKSAVAALTSKPDYGKDQLARNFVLGQALVLWAQQPGIAPTARRADLGYETNKDATVDLLAAADSAFRSVETAIPECAEKTAMFRQQPWVPLINQVGPLINSGNLDSASAVLARSMVIYRDSPYTYYFKGQIAQQKSDWPAAVEAYSKAVELAPPEAAAKDSNLASIREYTKFSTAYAQLRAAQAMSGEEQKAAMRKAAELYQAYLKEYPQGANAQPAQAGLTAALQSAGDTASLASLWAEMQANPSRYSAEQLYDAGAQAFAANQFQTAVRLMELGQKANPFLRAGLFNLANAYWKNNQFDKMLPVTRQLVQIDPNNPDNYQLVAIAFQGLEKAATDPKERKVLGDSVTKYVTASEKLPVRVTFSEFTHDGSKCKLAGSVENLRSAPTKTSLTVEFLDQAGKVVATQTAPLALGPKETKPFSLDADGASIVAYRYAEIK
jgi:tetratricopeptide (TPR) repeat protein